MTLAEFKAWFDGFTESMDGVPSEDQWSRIKARVREINGAPVTYPVFVDRYIEPYRRYWPSIPYWQQTYGTSGGVDHGGGLMSHGTPKNMAFNGQAAMLDLGKAEYKSMVS